MSKSRRERNGTGLAISAGLLAAALLAALALTGAGWGRTGVAAQEATPPVECVPPAGGDLAAPATPAEPAASPVPGEAPAGEPADEATAAAVAAAAANQIACWNAGNLSAFLDGATPGFITDDLGFADRTEAANGLTAMLAQGALPQLTLLELDPTSALTYEDGRASVDLTYMQGEYQLVAARWFFVMGGTDPLLDEELFLTPEPDVDFVTFIRAVIADDASPVAFEQSTTLPAIEAIVIQLVNSGESSRHLQLLQTAEGTTLNEDGTLPEGALEGAVEVAGVIVDGGGGSANMALINLPPGLYVLVDVETGEGAPLTITEPEA